MNQAELKDYVRYEPESGFFYWVKTSSPIREAGNRAGSFDGRYRGIQIKGKRYQEHRLAWFFYYGEWPVAYIDHINGDKQDNRIENLRLVDAFKNMQNQMKHINGKYWGVHFVRNKWHASIKYGKESIHIGVFDHELEAKGAVFGFIKGRGLNDHYGI